MKTALTRMLIRCLAATSVTPKNASETKEVKALPRQRECIVLLHGLARSRWAMKRLEWAFTGKGYSVINDSYPSRRMRVEDLAETWLEPLLRTPEVMNAPKVHFVAHSLGGVILRKHFSRSRLPNLGRVVMLGPPNQGSEVIDKLSRWPLAMRLLGPAAAQLGTGPDSLPKQLGPAPFEVGIIAGSRSLNPVLSSWVPGPSDGKVSVQSTRLTGMKAHKTVPRTHTWMAWRKDVISAAHSFIWQGTFERGLEPTATQPEAAGTG